MFYLREYRPKADRLFDHLPWVALIGPGLVLNKDGGFQKTLAFRGPDLASATDAGLVATRAQLNNALRRLGSRWCLHIEALRAALKYTDNPASLAGAAARASDPGREHVELIDSAATASQA